MAISALARRDRGHFGPLTRWAAPTRWARGVTAGGTTSSRRSIAAEAPRPPRGAPPRAVRAAAAEIVSVWGRWGATWGLPGRGGADRRAHRVFRSPPTRWCSTRPPGVRAQAAHRRAAGGWGRCGRAGGVAPFPTPGERRARRLGAGHACTAVSAALGIWRASRSGARRAGGGVIGGRLLDRGADLRGAEHAGASARPPPGGVFNDNQCHLGPTWAPSRRRCEPGRRAAPCSRRSAFSYVGAFGRARRGGAGGGAPALGGTPAARRCCTP